MTKTKKIGTQLDANQTLQGSYNDVNATLSVDGFLVGKVGHKVVRTVATTTVANDTEIYDFYDNADLLYQLTLVYTDATKADLISAERTM